MSHKKIADTLEISDAIVLGEDGEVQTAVAEYTPIVREVNTSKPTDQAVVDDYNYARNVLYDLVEKGSEAFNEALAVAKETKQARCFEVTSTLLKQVAEVSQDLLKLSHTAIKIENEGKGPDGADKNPESGATHQHIHVGTTDDLLKVLNEQAKK